MPRYATSTRICFDVFEDNDPNLEDVGDVGDEYLHRKPLNDVTITRYSYHDIGDPQDNAVRVRKMVTETLTILLTASTAPKRP